MPLNQKKVTCIFLLYLLRWSDGSDVSYFNWGPLQPDSEHGLELCVKLDQDTNKWYDANCASRLGFGCKKNPNYKPTVISLPSSTSYEGSCPSDWTQYGQKCYKVFGKDVEQRKTWKAALKDCINQGGIQPNLVSIHSENEQDFIISLTKHLKSSAWIGLVRHPTYVWSDNSERDYNNWNPGEPSTWSYGNDNSCVQMFTNEWQAGKWDDISCFIDFAYICQKKTDPSITSSLKHQCLQHSEYIVYDGNCYRFIEKPMSWLEALENCRGEGGDLASIKDIFEYAFITSHIKTDLYYWIGLNALKKKADYKWSDGQQIRFTRWADEEEERGSQCVVTTPENFWKDAFCYQKLPSLCKITNEMIDSIPQIPIIDGKCPNTTDKWHHLGKYCFLFNIVELKSFFDSKLDCARYKSNLASFATLQEMNQVYNLKKSDKYTNFWIGMLKTPTGFKWLDGSPISFTNWAMGKPSHSYSESKQYCVEMRFDGTWVDSLCKNENFYICKAEKEISPSQFPLSEKYKSAANTQQGGLRAVTVGAIFITLILVTLIILLIVVLVKKSRNL